MYDGNTAGVVYLGFTNAFDSINQRLLLASLESFGLCENVIEWIRSYPTGRNNRVKKLVGYLRAQ